VEITAMMESIPHPLNEVDPHGIVHIALWLHATAPLLEDAPRGCYDIQTEFSYFEVNRSKQ
jgi:hypothetical protein